MTCNDVTPLLFSYLDGELKQDLQNEITQHINTCPSCQEEQKRCQKLLQMMKRCAPPDLLPHFEERTVKRWTDQQQNRENKTFIKKWFQPLLQLSTAMIVFVIVYQLFQMYPSTKEDATNIPPVLTEATTSKTEENPQVAQPAMEGGITDTSGAHISASLPQSSTTQPVGEVSEKLKKSPEKKRGDIQESRSKLLKSDELNETERAAGQAISQKIESAKPEPGVKAKGAAGATRDEMEAQSVQLCEAVVERNINGTIEVISLKNCDLPLIEEQLKKQLIQNRDKIFAELQETTKNRFEISFQYNIKTTTITITQVQMIP